MNDQAMVQLVSDHDSRGQFGRFLLYRNKKPKKRAVVIAAVVLFVVSLTILLVIGGPDVETVNNGGFEMPNINPSQPTVNLPVYDRDKALIAEENAPPRARRAGRIAAPEKLTGPQLMKRPRGIKIPPGMMVKAQLLNGASNGLVKAKLLEPITVDGERLVEPGTIAMGSGSSTEERLFVKFSKLVYYDGTVDPVQAEACDQSDQTPGLKGSKVGYYGLKLAAGIGLNFAGGMAEGLQDSEGMQGATIKPATTKNALLNGASKAALEQSRDTMSDLKSKQAIIEVPASTTIFILFDE